MADISAAEFADNPFASLIPAGPVEANPFASLIPAEDRSVAFGSLGRGLNRMQQAGNILLSEIGIISPASAAKAIARDEADIAQYPVSPTYKQGMEEIGVAAEKGWGPMAWAMLKNPSTLLSVVGESIPASGAMLAGGVAGSVGGPAGMMGGAGMASFATEYSHSIMEVLQENKVDTGNADAIEAALQNPDLMHKARDRAVKRGVPIAMFDAISFGMAGKIARTMGATVEGATKARKIAAVAVEIGAQGVYGGAGEAAGQVAAGQELDRRAIGLEAAAEIVTGIPEVAIGTARQGVVPPPPPGRAEDIIPGVEIVPESEAPPAPVLRPTPGKQMVVNDPEITLANGEVLPAGAMNGQTVTVATSDENMSFVLDAEGKRHLIGNKLLAPVPPAGAPPAAPTLDEAMQQGVADEVAKRAAVPDSPRLTPGDRASPIPNDLIDEGKAATEAATGLPSTFTTTSEINGKRTVVTGRVADLVAELRANTEALAQQITAGVSVPQISPETALGAPPARTTEVPATSLPSEAAAAPEPSIAASGRYSDGGEWSAVYEPEQRSDGSFVLTRRTTDSDGVRVDHLDAQGTWTKGLPARTVMRGEGLAHTTSAAEEFATAEHALDLARDDIASKKGAVTSPAPQASAAEAPAIAAPEATLPEPRFQVAGLPETARPDRPFTDNPVVLERIYGAPGTQARTLEEARMAKAGQPIVSGDITVQHQDYESFIAYKDGKKVGELSISPQGPHASSVIVDPSAQRQGVATALYDAAEAALGRPMTPSPMGMSGDAIAFWKPRLAALEPEQKQALLQEALDKGIEQKIGKSARARVDALGYVEPAAAPREAPAARFAVTPGAVTPAKAAAPAAPSVTPKMTKAEFDAEVAKNKKKAEARKRRAKGLASIGETSVRMRKKTGERALVGPDMSEPGRFRVTFFDEQGAFGHSTRDTMEAAVDEALREGYVATGKVPELTESGRAINMRSPTGETVLVSGDTLDEHKGRVTKFDKQGKPVSHKTYDSIEEAAAVALREGNEVVTEPAAQAALKGKVKAKRVADSEIPFENTTTPENIVNHIDRSLSEEDKVAVLTAMSAESAPIIQRFMKAIDEKFGTKSSDDQKKPARILEKSHRPELLKLKEWHRVEHIRDSYRFKTNLDNYNDLPAIIEMLKQAGVTILKYDVKKVLYPKDYGWRVAAFDLMMPNGQLVEYYLAAHELIAVNEGEGHQLFENWRNIDPDEHTPETTRQMEADKARSRELYNAAWEAYLARTGEDESDVIASLNKVLASADDRAVKLSDRLPSVKPLRAQTPSLRYAENLLAASATTTKPSISSETQARTGISPTTELTSFPKRNVPQNAPEAKLQVRLVGQGAIGATGTGGRTKDQITIADIARSFHEEHMAVEGRQLFPEKEAADYTHVVNDMAVPELTAQMEQKRSGVGWYSQDTADAIDITSQLFPTLATNSEHRDLFLIYAGIFGNGPDPVTAWIAAGEAFDLFLRTGEIPVSRPEASAKAGLPVKASRFRDKKTGEMKSQPTGWTQRNAANEQQIALFKNIVEKLGSITAAMHWLTHPQPRSDINQAMKDAGYTALRYKTAEEVSGPDEYGALVFGPKLGRYVLGLNGIELTSSDATVDKWFVRTYRRWTGRLFEGPLDESGIVGRPNPKEKDIERRTIFRIVGDLAKRFKLKPGDVQAVLWFHEQRLYDASGVPTEAGTNTDGANKLLEQRGVKRDVDARGNAKGDRAGRKDEPRFSGRGRTDRLQADARAARAVQQEKVEPLKNLYELYPSSVGPNADVVAAKRAYMESIGLPYRRQAEYVEADPKRGKRIADAFDAMAHDPQDPQVAAAYRALIDETIAQYHAIQKALGLKIEFMKPGQKNPYNFSPRQAMQDVLENGHLWVYPTSEGYGSDAEAAAALRDNPMLEPTGIVIGGHPLVANDVFRIVHDIFGHGPEGAGFGPTGEENAWQSHVRMYSPLAARAMTSETRGQNSWVNYGPHGEANRGNQQATVYADQKVGLLPDWAMTEGMAADEAARLKVTTDEADAARRAFKERVARNAEMAREILPGQRQAEATVVQGGVIHFALSPAFADKAAAVFKDLRKILDSYGLTGVDLKVWQQMFADLERGAFGIDGMYLQNTIHYALNAATAPATTMHHEVVHGLWSLFTDPERAILSRKSNKEWITDEIRQNYPENQWTEEGVARAHAEWRKGMKVDGVIAKIFRKIDLLLKAIARALTGQDFRTAEDIFRQMSTGEIGRRGEIALEAPTPQSDGLFQIAWHGSKARFFKFSQEFFGTGQGEQRYGAGFYFARGADKNYAATFGDNVYKVDIPDTDTMLEWGEKLTNQPKGVQEKLEPLWKELGEKVPNNYDQDIYHWIGDRLAKIGDHYTVKNKAASDTLNQLGIPGISFERRGQKGAVVFDATNIEILSVNDDKVADGGVIAPNRVSDAAPRFHLQAPPNNQQQAQQVTQGFLNRGQPVDRAIRVPFSLLGGLDNQNRWSWGKRLSENFRLSTLQEREAAAIGGLIGSGIGTATLGPGVGTVAGALAGGTVGRYILGGPAWTTNGAFGWFGSFAENAKRGLISDYGLDPEYVEAYRQSDLGKAAIERQAAGILQVLSNAGVNSNEAKVLQQILSGEPVNDAAMIRLAQPIRQAIDDLGAEAVSLGLISAESFDRNRGAYLHRVYAKNEIDQGTMAGWVSAKMATRRKRIIGDTMKGRGMFWDMPLTRLMQDAGIHPEPNKGDKWVVLDRKSATGDKVTKRVFFPAGKPIPMEFQGTNWESRGEWEVRQTGKGEVTLWRDYTAAERTKMGELIDARYTIAKTFMLMANDISTGRFYRDVAAKQEWTRADKPPDGTWKEGGEYNAKHGRYWENPEIRWVKVPDTTISDTGGKKRWGALSGKWVRAEIWRDLNEINIASNPGTWRKIYAQWKRNKTARNPVVHMNNIVSNLMFMDLADVRMQDLLGGIKAYYRETSDYTEARDNGAFGSDIVSQELRQNVLKPILDEIAKQQSGGQMFTSPFLQRARVLGIVADKLWTWAKAADNGMLRAYQMEDEIFRMAAYMRRRSQGESPQVAARNARDQFLNYDIRAPWVVLMRNSLFPFISYTYRAVPKLMENILHRPWKVAKYAAIAYAVNALAYGIGDDDDDEEKERAALRDEEQGRTWLWTPRMLRMPWRDDNGLPVFLDVRRWVPAGDIFDSAQGSSAIPIPAPLNFGGPLALAFELIHNKKAFDGEEITNSLTDTNMEKVAKVADWAWKSWAPAAAWMPNSWYWTKISNAVHGATDIAGHPYSVPQALLSSIGIKVKPLDVDDGVKWHYLDFKKVQMSLRHDMHSLASRLERGLISQAAFDSGAAKLMEKFENLGVKAEELARTQRKK